MEEEKLCLALKKQFLRILLAITVYRRKTFIQIKLSADLKEIALVGSWDMLVRQGK